MSAEDALYAQVLYADDRAAEWGVCLAYGMRFQIFCCKRQKNMIISPYYYKIFTKNYFRFYIYGLYYICKRKEKFVYLKKGPIMRAYAARIGKIPGIHSHHEFSIFFSPY